MFPNKRSHNRKDEGEIQKNHSLLWLKNLQIVISLWVKRWNRNHSCIWWLWHFHWAMDYDFVDIWPFWKKYSLCLKKNREKLQLRMSFPFILTSKDSTNCESLGLHLSTFRETSISAKRSNSLGLCSGNRNKCMSRCATRARSLPVTSGQCT